MAVVTVSEGLVDERFMPLFDPTTMSPPAGAIEVYFETPVSLGMLLHFAEERGRDELVEAAVRAHTEATRAMLQSFALDIHLKVGEHIEIPGKPSMGRYLPGRVPLTVVSHTHVPGQTDVARMHDHVFIGRRGIADVDGDWWPVDLDSLRKNILVQSVAHVAALRFYLRDVWGMEWSAPEDRTELGFQELVGPNFAPSVSDFPRRICSYGYGAGSPDRWNVVDLVLPQAFPRRHTEDRLY
ncbi:hypothetical protein [Pseudonocardia sp. WMMC193]|uniref:hypothetical protein n=1 Tax=Pseudonocardia sp. WMMC193 TaxID=2911965 RepID=UPI001F3CF9E8|nr:hypothetical protein [Pseudonocardia sp. WMMC193]MCF7547299.1 hypothetical protein [Pseudonocardia sp. WMMC193]